MRFGIGFDAHRFAEGRPLMLGGVLIPHPRGLEGHSDADVLLHALADAALGAAALGDLGELYPSADQRWRNAEGSVLLAGAVERVAAAGWAVVNADATVIAAEPALAPHRREMREAVAAALGVPVAAVSVKATTTDGMGFAGRGEGIAALAIVALQPR